MEPAATIIRELGGPSAVAKICGVHRTRVSNWMRPKERGGTGGTIPQAHHRVILKACRERGIERSAETLLPIAQIAPEHPLVSSGPFSASNSTSIGETDGSAAGDQHEAAE